VEARQYQVKSEKTEEQGFHGLNIGYLGF